MKKGHHEGQRERAREPTHRRKVIAARRFDNAEERRYLPDVTAHNWIEDVRFGDDGLVPVVAQSALAGEVLMVAYADRAALERTRDTGEAHYHSRSRSGLWKKGETSGHTQAVAEVRVDCDGDAVLYVVRQSGPACHTGAPTCFGEPSGGTLVRLAGTIARRARERPEGSYTARLLSDGVARLAQKLGEEAVETVVAATAEDGARLASEAADLLYHLLVLLEAKRLPLERVLWSSIGGRERGSRDGVRTPPHAQRILPPRRRQPHSRSAGPRPGTRHGLAGDHRSRQPPRGLAVLRGGEGPQHPADPRVRGVPRLREPPAARAAERRPRRLLAPRAARPQPHRLPQPRRALVHRLPRGLLPPAAHRPRSAGAAQGRADRARRLPVGRSRPVSAAGELRGGEGERPVFRRPVLARRLLAGGPEPRHPRGEARHRGHVPAVGRAGGARGGDERRALSPQGRRRGPRRAARHRHGKGSRRPEPVPVLRAGELRQVGAGDVRAVPGPPRRHRGDGTTGGAVRVRLREALLPAAVPSSRGVRERHRPAGAPRPVTREAPQQVRVA